MSPRVVILAAQPWRRARAVLTLLVFGLPLAVASACVLRLNDRNEPLESGGVTGPVANCSAIAVEPAGGPGTGAPATKFVGRYDLTDPATPRFDWSGNYMSTRFEGTEVTFGANAGVETIFEVIVDGQARQVILGGLAEKSFTVRVPQGIHEVTVMRSSEALFGDVAFVPFTFGTSKQLPPTERPRRIEYIGDSITCGYGNEGENATCPYDTVIRDVTGEDGKPKDVKIPLTQNVYLAYGSLAARALSADAVTLCFSGKGVFQNYREQGVGEGKILNPDDKPDPDARTTIPDYYLRTVATDPALAKWDFSKEPEPQVVLINIGTNDFARDVNQDSIADGIDLERFRTSYKDFVGFVRTKRPNAHIFLALPPMLSDKFPLDNARSDFRNALKRIVSELEGSGDGKIYFMELVEMGVRYGLGCDYHPNLEVHRIMADQVIGAIRSKTCW